MKAWLARHHGAIIKAIEVAALLWIAVSLHDLATNSDLYLLRYLHDDLKEVADKLDDLRQAITLK